MGQRSRWWLLSGGYVGVSRAGCFVAMYARWRCGGCGDMGDPPSLPLVRLRRVVAVSGPGASSPPRRWGLLAVLADRFGNQGATQLSVRRAKRAWVVPGHRGQRPAIPRPRVRWGAGPHGWPQGAAATVPRPQTKQLDGTGSSSETPVAPSALCPVCVPLCLACVKHPPLGPPFGIAPARSRHPFPVPHPAARAGAHPNSARAGGRRRLAPDREPPVQPGNP